MVGRERAGDLFFWFSPIIIYLCHKHVYMCVCVCMCVCVSMGFSGGSVVKDTLANTGDSGSIPDLGRSPGEGDGNPF